MLTGASAFYWDETKTDMVCMSEAIRKPRENAYAHHIQRLMVTGNFALIAGCSIEAVCDWYLSVYADAYEWVELPNTLGMALFADGGVMASKPYCSVAKYIDRMSDLPKDVVTTSRTQKPRCLSVQLSLLGFLESSS